MEENLRFLVIFTLYLEYKNAHFGVSTRYTSVYRKKWGGDTLLCVLIEYTFAVLLILACREGLCQAPSTSPICSLCYREHNDFSSPLPSKINVEICAWYA